MTDRALVRGLRTASKADPNGFYDYTLRSYLDEYLDNEQQDAGGQGDRNVDRLSLVCQMVNDAEQGHRDL